MEEAGISVSSVSPLGLPGEDATLFPVDSKSVWTGILAQLAEKNLRLLQLTLRSERRDDTATLVMDALERERGRMARELHAGAGQPLAGIRLHLQLLEELAPHLPPEARTSIAQLHRLADDALQQVRAVSHRNHPPDWQKMNLVPAIQTLSEDSGIRQKLDFAVEIGDIEAEPPHSVRVVLYRCVQECVSNIIRHSGATSGELYLAIVDGRAELQIRDNGGGFVTEQPNRGGIGLRAIRSQTEELGGTYRIASTADGTTIAVSIPLEED